MGFIAQKIEPSAYISIDGRFPGMNEYTKACRANRMAGAEMKKTWQYKIEWHLKEALRGKKFDSPLDFYFDFNEPNKRRDKDNISAFFHKIFFDAMQEVGAIPNDGWDNIHLICDTFEVNKDRPHVSVLIYETVEVK